MITVADKSIKLQIWDTVIYRLLRPVNNPSSQSQEDTTVQQQVQSSSMISQTDSPSII